MCSRDVCRDRVVEAPVHKRKHVTVCDNEWFRDVDRRRAGSFEVVRDELVDDHGCARVGCLPASNVNNEPLGGRMWAVSPCFPWDAGELAQRSRERSGFGSQHSLRTHLLVCRRCFRMSQESEPGRLSA